MAVSGHKLSDFQGSESLGSAEDIEHICEPCRTIGEHVELHGLCVDCKEYLCRCNKTTQSSQNHQLLHENNADEQAFPSNDSNEKTETSAVHKSELSKYFCTTYDSITYKEDVNLITKSSKNDRRTRITGCAVLSCNKLVLVDNYNRKLKVVDTQSKYVIEEKTLFSSPWDIATLPQDQIAITFPVDREILVMTTAGHLSDVNKIPVKYRCMGITYCQDFLYVVCNLPACVIVLNTQGAVQKTISMNNDIFRNPQYILLSEDSRRIYITDSASDLVVSITLHGDISAKYKDKRRIGPGGMSRLDDGSLLVCFCNGTVHHISGDLKQSEILTDDVPVALTMCYNQPHDEVYISCSNGQLKVYSMTRTDRIA